MQMTIQERYRDGLQNMPAPGGGCHAALLSVANYGTMAGIQQQAIYDDIRRAIPQGSRRIPDKEINDAIRKATQDHNSGISIPRLRPATIVRDGKAALQKIINQAKITAEVDLWESSPIRLWEAP